MYAILNRVAARVVTDFMGLNGFNCFGSFLMELLSVKMELHVEFLFLIPQFIYLTLVFGEKRSGKEILFCGIVKGTGWFLIFLFFKKKKGLLLNKWILVAQSKATSVELFCLLVGLSQSHSMICVGIMPTEC